MGSRYFSLSQSDPEEEQVRCSRLLCDGTFYLRRFPTCAQRRGVLEPATSGASQGRWIPVGWRGGATAGPELRVKPVEGQMTGITSGCCVCELLADGAALQRVSYSSQVIFTMKQCILSGFLIFLFFYPNVLLLHLLLSASFLGFCCCESDCGGTCSSTSPM